MLATCSLQVMLPIFEHLNNSSLQKCTIATSDIAVLSALISCELQVVIYIQTSLCGGGGGGGRCPFYNYDIKLSLVLVRFTLQNVK